MKYVLAVLDDHEYHPDIILRVFNNKQDLLDYLKKKDIKIFVKEDTFDKPCGTQWIGERGFLANAYLTIVND